MSGKILSILPVIYHPLRTIIYCKSGFIGTDVILGQPTICMFGTDFILGQCVILYLQEIVTSIL